MRKPEEGEKRDEEAAREERGRWEGKMKEEEGWGSQKREKRGMRKPQERRGGDGMIRKKRKRDKEARRGREEGWGSQKR
jgi:hypothetical protein